MLKQLIKVIKSRNLRDRGLKKDTGFSTFLRGCNPVLCFIIKAQERQISPLLKGKNKTIFHKAENRLTFDGQIIIN